MKISIDTFAGTFPKVAPHLLPPSGAQQASNVRTTSGSLRALNTPSRLAANITPNAKTIYSLGPLGGASLLSWGADVDVAASPVSDDEYRVYYTDGTTPKKTSLTLATSGAAPYPYAWYHMGTPAPTAAPTLGTTTGSVAAGTYAYVFTYVTRFGTSLLEESAPSPAANVTLGATGGVTVTFPANPSTTNRNYVYKRVYRTSGTAYVLAAEVPFADGSYTDNLASASIPGTALPSLGWLPPPSDLQGVCTLPSGVLVGFRSNEIWFSEPGFPHAWPVKYMQALDAKVVAIKAFGNNVAVATTLHPYLGTGVYPDAFTFTKLPMLEPCVSKRSMAADEEGAIYAGNNGLVSIGLNGMEVLTKDVMTRQEFAALTPATMVGIVFERRYYGFTAYADVLGTVRRAIVVGRGEPVGVRYVEVGAHAVALEPTSGQLFYVSTSDGSVRSMDPIGTAPMTYVWKSKRFQLPAPVNFSCLQIHSQEITLQMQAAAASIAAANAAVAGANATVFASGALLSELNAATELNTLALNDSVLQPVMPSVSSTVSVSIYAGSELKWSGSVAPNKVYRLPGGFKSLGWEVELSGQSEVTRFEMATSVAELKAS